MSCCVPGCSTRNVKKLADHLRVVLSNLTIGRRHHYLSIAREHAERVSAQFHKYVILTIDLSLEGPPGVTIQQAIRRVCSYVLYTYTVLYKILKAKPIASPLGTPSASLLAHPIPAVTFQVSLCFTSVPSPFTTPAVTNAIQKVS